YTADHGAIKQVIEPAGEHTFRADHLGHIAIIGISPPSGVGAVIICIIKPNTSPAIRPASAPIVILERMIIFFLSVRVRAIRSPQKKTAARSDLFRDPDLELSYIEPRGIGPATASVSKRDVTRSTVLLQYDKPRGISKAPLAYARRSEPFIARPSRSGIRR